MYYPIDLHTHTVASTHAYSTLMEYITVAKQRNLRMFATTDHGPSAPDAPHPWHFSNLRVIPRLIDGIGILRGIEANILNINGEIDCSEKMLNSLDIVLAGLHSPDIPKNDKEGNTQALVNTIKSGRVDIITHPGNPSYPIDIQAVVEAAAEYNVALEVNNASLLHSREGSRPYCVTLVQAVKKVGGIISLGSDSHFASYLGDFSQAQRLLDEVNFPVDRILNNNVSTLLTFLESRGHIVPCDWAVLKEKNNCNDM